MPLFFNPLQKPLKSKTPAQKHFYSRCLLFIFATALNGRRLPTGQATKKPAQWSARLIWEIQSGLLFPLIIALVELVGSVQELVDIYERSYNDEASEDVPEPVI